MGIEGTSSIERNALYRQLAADITTPAPSPEAGDDSTKAILDALGCLLRALLAGSCVQQNAGGPTDASQLGAGGRTVIAGQRPDSGLNSPASPPAATPAPETEGLPGDDALSGAPQTCANTPAQSSAVARQYVQNLKQDFGLSDAQAAGIVGNLWHESAGMNSGVTQGGAIGSFNSNMADDNANGAGIAQWGGVRKQGLLDFAKAAGVDPTSQAANYGYLKQELSGDYRGAIDAVKATSDVAGATAAFCNAFEKPSDPQLGSRLALANQVLSSI